MGLSFAIERLKSKRLKSTGIYFSYTAFSFFRHHVARSCGLDVQAGTESNMYRTGLYKELEGHPIYPFIAHEDDDGELDSEECGKIGSALYSIVEGWEAKNQGDKMEIEQGKKLARVMMDCYKRGEKLIFI